MRLCVERRRQNSPSSAHPHEQPCGIHGAVTGLDVFTFIFHSYLGRLLKAWARFFDQCLFEAVLSLVEEVCVVGNAPAQCPLALGGEAVVLPRVVSGGHSILLVILSHHTWGEENFLESI